MTETKLHCEPIKLNLVGLDGNAFSLMGAFRRAASTQGRTPQEIRDVTDDCTSGDYNHLLSVIMKHTR